MACRVDGLVDYETGLNKVLYVNRAIRGRLDDAVGHRCYEALQNRDTRCSFCTSDRTFENGVDTPYRCEFQSPVDGHWYRGIAFAIRRPGGRMARCDMAVDTIDRKRFEQRLAYTRKMENIGALAGADGFLQKPYSLADLSRAMRAILRKR